MDQALAYGCVLPAAVGAGCCVVGPRLTADSVARRRPDPLAGVAMAVMALGMADTMLLGGALLPALAWTAVYAALAGGLHAAGCAGTPGRQSLHLVAMAVLTAAMASPHEHDAGGGGLVTLALAAGAGYTVYAAWVATRERGWARAELAASGLSAFVMGGAVAVM